MRKYDGIPTTEAIISEYTHAWMGEVKDGLLYIDGAEFPMKKVYGAEAVGAIGIVKRIITESARILTFPQLIPSVILFLVLPKRKFIEKLLFSFNQVANKLIAPYRVAFDQLNPFAGELEIIIGVTLFKWGITKAVTLEFSSNISHIFEFDQAYRWRLQDLLTETTPQKLLTFKELSRLSSLAYEREKGGTRRVANQTKMLIGLFSLVILIPSLKKQLKRAILTSEFKNLQFDQSDIYWACFQTDYNYFGLSAQERMQMIKDNGWKIPNAHELKK